MTEDYRQLAEEALARAEKAAPGPWVVDSYDGCRIESAEDAKGRYMTIYDEGGHRPEEAEFIAAARSDVPALARAVLELSDRYERTVDLFGQLRGQIEAQIAATDSAADAQIEKWQGKTLHFAMAWDEISEYVRDHCDRPGIQPILDGIAARHSLLADT